MQEGKTYSLVKKEISYNPAMEQPDPVRALILERKEKLGKSLSDLSQKIGKNHAYLQQFVSRGIPRNLPEELRPLLAIELEVDEERLRGSTKGRTQAIEPRNARIGGAVRITLTVPAYGHAMGGKDGQFILNGNKVADILAPSSLAGIAEAYAVYVAGVSMEPRYFAGEVVFVNPRLPVRQGDFVVAQIRQHQAEGEAPLAYVKRFVSRDARRLRLEQFKPRKTLEFPHQDVVSVHRIIMSGDG